MTDLRRPERAGLSAWEAVSARTCLPWLLCCVCLSEYPCPAFTGFLASVSRLSPAEMHQLCSMWAHSPEHLWPLLLSPAMCPPAQRTFTHVFSSQGKIRAGSDSAHQHTRALFWSLFTLAAEKAGGCFCCRPPTRHGRNHMFFWALLVSRKRVASFSYSFPLWFITVCGIQFPVLCSRSLLAIYFIYSSVYLLYRITCIV